MRKQPVERLVAHDVRRALNLRLHSLTSTTICKRTLSRRFASMPESTLQTKAEGLASSVRTALGYWESNAASLSSKILTQYYAAIHFSIGAQIAGPNPAATLLDVQRHTENGHGLATLFSPGADFPKNLHIAALSTGHFHAFCNSASVDLSAVAFARRPRSWASLTEPERARLVCLSDLLRRIPELRPVIHPALAEMPLSFHVGHSSKNMALAFENTKRGMTRRGLGPATPSLPSFRPDPTSSATRTTYVDLYTGYGGAEDISLEFLRSLDLPITNWQQHVDEPSQETLYTGEFNHPAANYWHQYLPIYESSNTGSSLVLPVWGIDDMFLIHFMILYGLSIVVRYLPSLWFDIDRGPLDHVMALLEQYVAVVEDVLPKMAIEKITGARLKVSLPGSLSAPR